MSVDIIAECGLNADGSLDKAFRMCNEVKRSGVTICKWQFYNPEQLLGKDSPYLEYVNKAMFTKQQLEQLKIYCDLIGLEFLVSVFDPADIPWANSLCRRHKVASRMNQNEAFIHELKETGKEVIISTQLAHPEPMHNVRYMFCITKYPTPIEDLAVLPCNKYLGLSSHCPDIKPSLAAIAQGATIIEHHVTFSREDVGCDHSSSITFDELRQLNSWANNMEIIKP